MDNKILTFQDLREVTSRNIWNVHNFEARRVEDYRERITQFLDLGPSRGSKWCSVVVT